MVTFSNGFWFDLGTGQLEMLMVPQGSIAERHWVKRSPLLLNTES